MASLSKINGVFYAMYRVNGKQFKKRIGAVPKTTALKCFLKLEEDLACTRMGLTLPKKIAIDMFFEEYLQYVKLNQAHKTYIQKKSSVNNFKHFMEDNHRKYRHLTQLHNITPDIIENFKLYRKVTGVTNRTINMELNCLSNSMRFAEEWGYLFVPMRIKRLPEQRKQPRYLSKEELRYVMESASAYLKQVITLFVLTGMRASELLNLKWEHVDFANNTVRVANTVTFTTKNKKDRIIPMNIHLRKTLIYLYDHYIDPNLDIASERQPYQRTYVLCSRDGSRIVCVRRAFTRLMDRLNIKGVNLHTLRHTFASHCVLNGVDILTIKEFLGHSRVTTTEIYTHLNQMFKSDQIQKLDGLLIPIN